MRELTKESPLEIVKAEVYQRVYDAALVFEELENLGLVHGNGHHMAQKVAGWAYELLLERWKKEEK